MSHYFALSSCKGEANWKVKSRIGEESSYGKVFIACCKENCRYILKVQEFGSSSSRQDVTEYEPVSKESIESEIALQNRAAKYGLALPVIDWWFTKHAGAMIMNVLKMTVRTAIKDPRLSTEKIIGMINSVFKIIHRLHQTGEYHGDTHLNNFMLDSNGRIYMIDFGRAGLVKDGYDLLDDYKGVILDLNVMVEQNEVGLGLYIDKLMTLFKDGKIEEYILGLE